MNHKINKWTKIKPVSQLCKYILITTSVNTGRFKGTESDFKG